jgi:hypothetical protein
MAALAFATISDYTERIAEKLAGPVLTTPALCRTPGGRVIDAEAMRRALEYVESRKNAA